MPPQIINTVNEYTAAYKRRTAQAGFSSLPRQLPMTRLNGIRSLTFLPFFFLAVAATNLTQCLANFRENGTAKGGVDYYGVPVTSSADAVGLTYKTCTRLCGEGQEPFDWSVFSQQFSAWLLPWLALVSQLPFGAENRLDNLISGESSLANVKAFSYHHVPVALTVGSPTLAAFSLALTAINTRWAYDRFSDINYPNRKNAAKALVCLQQVPLRLTTRDGLLASLIVLPENDDWWECLVDRLEQTHTWTIAAATSIIWVIIAFVFTIVDSFMDLGKNLNSNGQGVGSLWMWLIPIVVGWLWIPVCSYDRLKIAIDKANDLAYVAAPDDLSKSKDSPNVGPPSRACEVSHMQGIGMEKTKKVFTKDAARAAPVFNYSRIWEWSSTVETIARAFEHADKKARRHIPVNPKNTWEHSRDKYPTIHHNNRTGTIVQAQDYCNIHVQGKKEPARPVPPGMGKRILIASVFALGLQWGTTGSAAIVVFFTPTTGLGCRSGSYIIYGSISIVVWLALLLSSYLAHYAKVRHGPDILRGSRFNSPNLAKGLATFLRRLSIMTATCNAIFIILACVFQFSNFYNTCYCNASVLGRGSRNAYVIITPRSDYDFLQASWIGGIALAGMCVFLFLVFLHLMLEPSRDICDR